jgi:Sigma-70 factor, region 1.2
MPISTLQAMRAPQAHTGPGQPACIDSVAIYLAEIGTMPLFTARQEPALAADLAFAARRCLPIESAGWAADFGLRECRYAGKGTCACRGFSLEAYGPLIRWGSAGQ